MNRQELISRLRGLEWDDFEVKEAHSDLPKSVWETVSAFANTGGGWIVFGVRQSGADFTVTGVVKPEKIDQDFIGTLRSHNKFNTHIECVPRRFDFDDRIVLCFYIRESQIKPVYYGGNTMNTFLRLGSGDQRATETEVSALLREQAFGTKSELVIKETSIEDLDIPSFQSYRRTIVNFNPSFDYNGLPDEEFCAKTGITVDGHLTYASLLVLGNRDTLHRFVPNFWVDYLEIPGSSYRNAIDRYTYRLPEQENIWQAYLIIFQRLRKYADNPFVEGAGGFGIEDEQRIYSLREGLVNFLCHADYFSPMHSVIRVYDDRIEMQNPGRFAIPLPTPGSRIQSVPRNPSILKLFRFPRLSENAGYGIDKVLMWRRLTDCEVCYDADFQSTTVTYFIKSRTKESDKFEGESGNRTKESDKFEWESDYRTKESDKLEGESDNLTKESDKLGCESDNRTKAKEEAIVAFLAKHPNSKRETIATQFNISDSSAKQYLKRLVAKGLVLTNGKARNITYSLPAAEI